MEIYRALSIAGSDPSGGAGIQADLKTFSALGVYGATVITAVVDENTQGVTDVHPIPVSFVAGQIHSVLDDVGADAIKIGMLHSSELILAVKKAIGCDFALNTVLDPVMVATSGDKLLQDEAVDILKKELVPFVRVITPNIPEAEILLGEKIPDQKSVPDAARRMAEAFGGKVSVFLKAGHLSEEILTDIFYNAEEKTIVEFPSKRIDTKNTHGTGCTFSSALAAFLAKGFSLSDAALCGKKYVYGAILAGKEYSVGKGHGPVHHFWNVPNWGGEFSKCK